MIFQHFRAIYLNKWTDQYSDSQALKAGLGEWTIGLRGLTEEQIMRGVDECREHEEWPPSIAVFIKYAKNAKSIHIHSKAYQPWLTLSKPKGDPVLALEAITQIKLYLK
jgi:hypothetical protein